MFFNTRQQANTAIYFFNELQQIQKLQCGLMPNEHDGRPVEYRWRPLFNAAKFG